MAVQSAAVGTVSSGDRSRSVLSVSVTMIAARPATASRRSAVLMGKGIGIELYYDVAVIGGGAVGRLCDPRQTGQS
jgi:hypothetical protein